MVDFLLRRDEEGQTLAEYALILALIAILAILALLFLGGQINADPVADRQRPLGSRSEDSDSRAARPSGDGPLLRVRCWPSVRASTGPRPNVLTVMTPPTHGVGGRRAGTFRGVEGLRLACRSRRQ